MEEKNNQPYIFHILTYSEQFSLLSPSEISQSNDYLILLDKLSNSYTADARPFTNRDILSLLHTYNRAVAQIRYFISYYTENRDKPKDTFSEIKNI